MRTLKRLRNRNEQGSSDERGAALVEFAIALPIFIALLALVFDAGLGYSASRSSAQAARASARVGALAGDSSNADFRVLDALRASYGDGEDVRSITIYLSDPDTNPEGIPPESCDAVTPCTKYPGSVLNSLTEEAFTDKRVPTILPDGSIGLTCADDAPDVSWCPLGRRQYEDQYLGVYIESTSQAAVGIGAQSFDLGDRAVFALYFPPVPVVLTPTPGPTPP